jgi:hypothetical protein
MITETVRRLLKSGYANFVIVHAATGEPFSRNSAGKPTVWCFKQRGAAERNARRLGSGAAIVASADLAEETN